MHRFTLLTAAAAILGGCGLGAPAYPTFNASGYRIEGNSFAADAGSPTRTVAYRDGPNFRVQTILPRYGRAIVVFDRITGNAYVLNPTLQTSKRAPIADRTVESETSPRGAGVALRITDADAPQPLETQWAALSASSARSVADCNVAGQSGHEWQPKRASTRDVERTACITPDGIVLRLRENNHLVFDATRLQRGRQNPALFGVPSGYRMINPDSVTMGAGERVIQLNSVTNAIPSRPPASSHG